jgi:quercetin dioxygenase-like cupin family protein
MTHHILIRRVTEGPSFSPFGGIEGRPVSGADAMAILVRFDPDVVVPRHRHEQEQLGVVIAGGLTLGHDDGERDLVIGDAYVIPRHVYHWARAGADGCTCVEVFSPPRQDYLDFIAETPRDVLT